MRSMVATIASTRAARYQDHLSCDPRVNTSAQRHSADRSVIPQDGAVGPIVNGCQQVAALLRNCTLATSSVLRPVQTVSGCVETNPSSIHAHHRLGHSASSKEFEGLTQAELMRMS